MITTLQRISELESLVSGFTTTVSSRWGHKKFMSVLNEGRAIAISNSMQGGKRVHPDWLQRITIDYDENAQVEDCFSTFNFPYTVISVSKIRDGFEFIGNEDFTAQYTRINTRGDLINMRNHPILARTLKSGVGALYEDGQFHLYRKNVKIKKLGVIAIFNDPTELPYFNLQTDNYPIDDTTFDWIKGYLKQTYLNQIESTNIKTETTAHDTAFQVKPSRR